MKAFFAVALLVTSSVFSQSLPIDNSFQNGLVESYFQQVYSAVELPQNRLLIGGNIYTYNGNNIPNLAVLNENGSLYSGFYCGDCVDGTVGFLAKQGEQILVAGNFQNYNGVARKYFARINQDGSLDTTFDASASLNAQIGYVVFTKVSVWPAQDIFSEDKIYISGSFADTDNSNLVFYDAIYRLNNDGTLDSSFQLDESFIDEVVYDFIIQPDGKIITSGSHGLQRLNIDGSLDDSFVYEFSASTSGNMYYSLLLDDDGKIFAGGLVDSVEDRHIVSKFNNDGTIDESFITAYVPYPVEGIPIPHCYSLAKYGSKILVGGVFFDYGDSGSNDFVAINSDGTVDSSFSVGNFIPYNDPIGPDDAVIKKIIPLSNGKVIVIGNFGMVDENPSYNIIRIGLGNLELDSFSQNSDLNIYCNDNLWCFKSQFSTIYNISIFDLSGKLIDKSNVNSDSYSYQLQNNSILLYRLTMTDGKIYTGKMIN